MAETKHRFVPIGDVEIFYRQAGDLDAPAVLLLHGFHAMLKPASARAPTTLAARNMEFFCAARRSCTKERSGYICGNGRLFSSTPSLSTSARCRPWRGVSCAICSLQLNPSARMMVD